MSAAVAPRENEKRNIDWYKWAVGVAVPLIVAVIGLIKLGGGDKDTVKTPNNTTFVTSISIIENQYQQITGQPLTDAATKAMLASAVNLAKAGQWEESRKLFEQLAVSIPVAAVHNNLGALNAAAGKPEAARAALLKAVALDPGFKPASDNLEQINSPDAVRPAPVSGGRESEPNNDLPIANVMPLAKLISGVRSSPEDDDCYQFVSAATPRDWVKVTLRNDSTTLSPAVMLYDANRDKLKSESRSTPGASLDFHFVAEPKSTYYLRVGHYPYASATAGAYSLIVEPLKSFDNFEPNDDIDHPARISLEQTVKANLLDPADQDFYEFTSGPSGKLAVTLKGSATLSPSVTIRDANRKELRSEYSGTAGGHLDFAVDVTPKSKMYVAVRSYIGSSGSQGAYTLTLR